MASKTYDFNGIRKLVGDKALPKLVLMTGEEDYYIDYTIQMIKKAFLGEGAEQMDYVKLDLDGNMNMEKILDNVMLPPWLSEKRIILVKNSGLFGITDPKKEFSDSFAKFAAGIPDTSLVLFWEMSVDKRKKAIWNVFDKEGIIFESQYLKEPEIADRLSRSLSKFQITMDQEAMDSLISRCDRSMRVVVSEYNKLSLYCMEKGISNIDISIVDKLCVPDVRGSVFNVLDSVSNGDASTALVVVDELIAKKEPVARIKFMFCKHLKQLICAKELGTKDKIVKTLGIHPYTAQKLAAQAPKFSMDKLLYLFSACTKSDYDARIGKLEERESLEILLVLACKSLS